MATYFVSAATGNDADDGLSEANAWLTIDKAMNTVAAGDKVWVKADGNYNETATIDTQGTNASPIVFEGYTSATGDNGKATIDGQSTRASGILDSLAVGRAHYVFKNFIITGHTSHGVNTDQRHIHWKNCHFTSNGGNGISCQVATFEDCLFQSNTGDGINAGTLGPVVVVASRFYSNGGDGIDCSVSLAVLFSEFFSNGSVAILGGQANETLLLVVNCTIDGDTKDTTDGIQSNVSFQALMVVLNTIVYDCTNGMVSNLSGDNKISRNNLVNSNTANYSSYSTLNGEVTSAPSFTNEGAQDYTLQSASPAKNAGYDRGGGAGMDIGANQMTDAAGAAGGITNIRIGGNL